jgi:hypothetical protein
MSMLRADLGTNRAHKGSIMRSRGRTNENIDYNHITQVKNTNLEVGAQNSYLSISKMDYVGLEPKSGYLMKKSSILGRYMILCKLLMIVVM